MKKILGLVVIVSSLFLLTSCGDETVKCTGPDGDYVNMVFDEDGNLVSLKGQEDGEAVEYTDEQIDLINGMFALTNAGSIRDALVEEAELEEGWSCD